MPADVIGTRIYNQKDGEFQVSLGPVFANLVLADEINRAPAKVQSALLEVMQERQVTIGRETFTAPNPFLVMATQNPIESEGTYALPEAQVDRFMLKTVIGYPTPSEEFVVVERMTSRLEATQRVLEPGQLVEYQKQADAVYVDPAVIEYAVRLVGATRNPASVGLPEIAKYLSFGASPRASINLVLAGKALVVPARSRLRPAAGRARPRVRRDAAPARALLRGAGRGHRPGRPARADPARRVHARRAAARATAAAERGPVDRPATLTEPEATASPLTAERLLRRLEWRVVRRLDGRLQGDYRTLFRGSGVDFTDLREYAPGDDLRHIDWNVTARMDTPYVREYVEDREVTCWLLLDRTASMGFGPVDRQKSLVLAEVATTLAHVLSRGGNRIGAALFDGTIETIPPGQGRNQVLRIAQALLRRPPTTQVPGGAAPPRRRWGSAETRGAVGVGGHHRPVRAAACRARAGPASLAARHRVGLHHPARVGEAPVAAGATPRRRRHPGRRPPRVRAAGGRDGLRRGLRDRGADLRRHQRLRLP